MGCHCQGGAPEGTKPQEQDLRLFPALRGFQEARASVLITSALQHHVAGSAMAGGDGYEKIPQLDPGTTSKSLRAGALEETAAAGHHSSTIAFRSGHERAHSK